MQPPLSTLLLAGVLALLGCSDQGVCTLDARPAVEVEVREAGSDQFIADVARGVVREGTFIDSLRVVGYIGTDPALPTTLGAAYERVGTYEVHLEAEGHASWDTAGVAADFDGCHVRTAKLIARLETTI